MKQYVPLFENYLTGQQVIKHIKDITPNEEDLPTYFFKMIKDSGKKFQEKQVSISDLMKSDPSLTEYIESGEDRYSDSQHEPTQDELNNPIVVLNGEILDGYSRIASKYRSGEEFVTAYIAEGLKSWAAGLLLAASLLGAVPKADAAVNAEKGNTETVVKNNTLQKINGAEAKKSIDGLKHPDFPAGQLPYENFFQDGKTYVVVQVVAQTETAARATALNIFTQSNMQVFNIFTVDVGHGVYWFFVQAR